MTDSGAVIDVVRPKRPGQFREEVVLLVRTVGRTEKRQRVRSERLTDRFQTLRRARERLPPGRRNEIAILTNPWLCQPIIRPERTPLATAADADSPVARRSNPNRVRDIKNQ